MQLENIMQRKNILIVGASRGLGLALAEAFVAESSKLWLVSRNKIESKVSDLPSQVEAF